MATHAPIPGSRHAPQGGAAHGSEEWHRWAARARLLSWTSLVLIAAEGAVAITAGVLAGSMALVGFGLDSVIEGFASIVIIWRFTGTRTLSEHAERRAQQLVAIQFFLLAPYLAVESIRDLIAGDRPEVSRLGIALAFASAVTMPLLGAAKRRVAHHLGSSATHGEGTQNILCGVLAVALLIGLGANARFGAWWLDPIVALLIAAVAVREGVESWRGEVCSCAVVVPDPGERAGACGCPDATGGGRGRARQDSNLRPSA